MPHKVPFRVVHVSGQDENFKAVELNSHSPTVKGWQSCKFCLYPQDIVIYLEQKCRLRKIQILAHQFLIPTKIEIFTGDVPDGVPHSLQNARYTRLGYVSFSDNEKTRFRARELKSVHVDAIGVYIKLVVHKNYINKHNLYNQVGVVAINIIGDEIVNPLDINRDPLQPPYDVSSQPGKDDILSGNFRRSDYISPMEDLAFDMYQDPEVASLCRKLDKKKQTAVMEERYDYARRLRDAILQLHKCGEKLGRLEVEKRQAIECENYEAAKVKKIQMDEYRLKIYRELDVGDLMEDSGPFRFSEPNQRYTPPPLTIHSPLPPVNHSPSPPQQQTARSIEQYLEEESSPRERDRTPYDPEDRPLPALKAPARETRDEPPPVTDDEPLPGEPEKMSERDMREAATAIDIFGLPLVSKAYSKTWSHREDGFLELYKRLQDADFAGDKDEVKANFRSAVFLLQRGVKDKVFAVFHAALNLNKFLLTQFVDKHQIPKPDVHFAVDKIVPLLYSRIGETAPRLRDMTSQHILDMSHWHQVSQFQSYYTECLRPFKPVAEQRLALGKTELVTALYNDTGISPNNHGITMDNIMHFLVPVLEHKAGNVREAAEKLIIQLYSKNDKNAVRSYLPPDTNKTRKNTLYRHLFEAFDRVDGKPSKEELARQSKAEEARKNAQKQKEIEELQSQLQELRNLTGPGGETAKTPRQSKPANKPAAPKKTQEKPQNNPAPAPAPAAVPPTVPEEPDEALLQLENTCIFCGERNEDFTEEGLDVHYWKNCPMLRRCANCKQVVEIATLTEHLLTECEAKDNFSQCPRCSEAIPKPDYDQHVREKLCNPGPDVGSHCPLCHENFTPGDDDWKNHLMGQDGCKQNPRRVAAINNQGKQGGKGGTKRSQLPKPTTRTGTK